MNARQVIIVACLTVLLLSSGAGLAGASHGDGISDWIDDITSMTEEGENDYGISDPYILFSSDNEPLPPDASGDDFSEHFDDDANLKTFYEVGDYTAAEPPEAVRQWNQQNRREFSHGGRSKSVYPRYKTSDLNDSNDKHIQDAYVAFYSIDPSTEVHIAPGDEGSDETEYRIAPSSDINIITSARVEAVPDGFLSRIMGAGPGLKLEEYDLRPSKKRSVSVEVFENVETRLYTTRCASGRDRCLVDRNTGGFRGGHIAQFDSPGLEAGGQTLTAEAEYRSRVNITLYDRDWNCDASDSYISFDNYDPDINVDIDCYWTDYEIEGTELITEHHTVSEERYVVVEEPDVKAMKANLPGGREEYYIYDLDKAEWSKLAWGANGEEDVGVRSAWRFFSARDSRWDVRCYRDGSGDYLTYNNPCGGFWAGDGAHQDADARPLLTHGIPSPANITQTGHNTILLDETRYVRHDYPNVEAHSTCNGDCHWQFPMYEDIDMENASYTEASAIAVQRVEESEYLRVYGLVEDNAKDVPITNERDVHLAKMDYEELRDGRDVSDEERQQRQAAGDYSVPAEEEVRIRVRLWDATTGDPIDLTDREDEYLIVSNGENTYAVRPGSDGVVDLNVKRGENEYYITYDHRSWWNVPDDEQAYVTESGLYASPGAGFGDSAWDSLFRLGILIGIPFVALTYLARAMGIDLRKEHLLWLFKGK